jgi:hypothetical protein
METDDKKLTPAQFSLRFRQEQRRWHRTGAAVFEAKL